MSCILITGSEGGLGKFIVNRLRKLYTDRTLIRISSTVCSSDDIDLIYNGDLRCKGLISHIFGENDIHTVVHCAAKWNGLNEDFRIARDNILMTLNLLDQSSIIKKFIYISSRAVYENETTQDENCKVSPTSSYGVSKLTSEQLIRFYSVKYNYPYTIWRPFYIMSPEERYNPGSSHICTDICYKIIEAKEKIDVTEFPKEKQTSYTWVDDIAECITSNIENDVTYNNVFNVGNCYLQSARAVVTEIVRYACSNKLIGFGAGRYEEDPFIVDYFKKAKEKLSWIAETGMHESVRKFIDYKYLK